MFGGGGITAVPLSYSSKQPGPMVPVSVGISFGCVIYAKSVVMGDIAGRPETNPPVDQTPGHAAAAVGIVGKPSYAFDLHLAGKHHPGLTEIVPQMKIRGLQLFAPERRGSSASS